MNLDREEKLRALALSLLTKPQPSAGKSRPLELIVTYRKHDDYEKFVRQIANMQDQLKHANRDIATLSLYAEENLRLYDQLKCAYKELKRAGLDTSYITSVRRRARGK